jgi:hypothetical protein
MFTTRKRNVTDEGRKFQEQWTKDYSSPIKMTSPYILFAMKVSQFEGVQFETSLRKNAVLSTTVLLVS